MKRGAVLIAIGGLLAGIALGLGYAWIASPVRYSETAPFSLGSEYKSAYRILIASAYNANGDLGRARARLELLGDPDMPAALAAQAQQIVASGGSYPDARLLALLAAALGQNPTRAPSVALTPSLEPTETLSTGPSPATAETSAAVGSPTPAPAASLATGSAATPIPLPTRTQTPTPRPPFVLKKASPMCDPNLGSPLIQVQVTDKNGDGVAAVEVRVTWSGGQDSFFTGLKPETGAGYADFSMTPGIQYTLRLADGGQPVENLAVADCPGGNGATAYPGGWLIEFTQP